MGKRILALLFLLALVVPLAFATGGSETKAVSADKWITVNWFARNAGMTGMQPWVADDKVWEYVRNKFKRRSFVVHIESQNKPCPPIHVHLSLHLQQASTQ